MVKHNSSATAVMGLALKELRTRSRPKQTHCTSLLLTYYWLITTLVIIRNILDYLLSVTKKLQNKDSGIVQSTDLIKSIELAKSNK